MIEKIFIFIIFLCPLVFFHELGHFLFARLFGVRVETFSIGFGPKILKYKRKDTEYAFSLIPLGGYVKMFGDDPYSEKSIPEDQKQFSFLHKSKFARFWIVFGGPLANVLLAFIIYYSLFLIGERIPEMKFGQISEKSALFQTGVRPGDTLSKINGQLIHNPTDLDLQSDRRISSVTVKRRESELSLSIDISGQDFLNELIANPPVLRVPVVIDLKGNRYVLSLDEKSVNWDYSLDEFSYGAHTAIHLLQLSGEGDYAKLKVDFEKHTLLEIGGVTGVSFFEKLYKSGYRSHDLFVKKVAEQSAAKNAGIEAWDIISEVNGKGVYSFDSVREVIKDATAPVEIVVLRNGLQKKFILTPQEITEDGKASKVIGVYSSKEYIPIKYVRTASRGIFGSIIPSFARTYEIIGKTLEGFKKLLTTHDSYKNIGGPIAIGKVAADSFNTSLSNFFQIMALISINLGIINLFPIPVLDGGHIMFIILEVLNRGPLSRRKMEIAQQFGLSLLLLLMFAALFNDVTRFF